MTRKQKVESKRQEATESKESNITADQRDVENPILSNKSIPLWSISELKTVTASRSKKQRPGGEKMRNEY